MADTKGCGGRADSRNARRFTSVKLLRVDLWLCFVNHEVHTKSTNATCQRLCGLSVDFHSKLAHIMDNKRITTRDVGCALGLDHSSVARWLHDSRPRRGAAEKLAKYLDVSLEELMDDERSLSRAIRQESEDPLDPYDRTHPDAFAPRSTHHDRGQSSPKRVIADQEPVGSNVRNSTPLKLLAISTELTAISTRLLAGEEPATVQSDLWNIIEKLEQVSTQIGPS